jgi:hypothetical protein
VRKLSIAVVAIIALCAFATVAYAANVYKVTPVGTSGGGKGTAAKPASKSVKFGFTAKDSSGSAATPIKTYSIEFEGLKSFAKYFPKCTFSQANGASFKSKCAKAKVGSGIIDNSFGAAGAPNPGECPLNLTLYNLGTGLALRLDGSPTTKVPGIAAKCPITVAQAVNAKFTSKKVGGISGSALTFKPQNNLLHPVANLNNAISKTVANISGKTTKIKIKGKTRKVSILSSTGCKGSTRTISVVFTDEKGSTVPSSGTTGC